MAKIENYVVDKNGNGTIKEVKVAKKNYQRKHTNDGSFGDPKGGHELQNLPPERRWKA